MLISKPRYCQCAVCQQGEETPTKKSHQMINLFLSQLDEQQRRWFVALEANQLGRGGVRRMSEITGMDEKTIHRGQLELERGLSDRPDNRIRIPGGGRPLSENKIS